ncbi:hypothetical protein BD626DRAFT_480146 [Schizophyllum amplum]|uniref:Glutamine synthetase n=1 Tax=Schizophyllum amplum TaxID=97359 RepID=A0A550CSZ0_9AGAR|nr:hypothetical protein BD626DRAFT_480146 [Auriculariopsis ampla]
MKDFSHGIQYTPDNVADVGLGTLKVEELADKGISYVRVQWVDFTNVVRVRVVPLSYFLKVLESKRPGFGVAKATFGLVHLNMAPGTPSAGEYLLVPDLSTIRLCPYAPGHASVLGWFEEKSPPRGSNSVETSVCPRTLLKRVLEGAKESEAKFLVGMEHEFVLLKNADPVEPINYGDWAASNALPGGTLEAAVLQEIADSVQASGIELQLYHGEAAPGQFEIVTGPLPPLEAADAIVHTREIISHTAAKHGLRATFAPRPFMTSCGSAAHIHISVHSPKDAQKEPEVLSPYEKSFLAGVLAHLPAIPALTLPTPASYKRMFDGAWSGGTYVAWGAENRECPVRVVNTGSLTSRRFEVRCSDATANPHLAFAAIVAAGVSGLQTMQELEIKGVESPQTPGTMSEAERKALGITQRLPLDIQQARQKLQADDLFVNLFGTEFMEKYLAVNKLLGDILTQDADEAQALTRLVKFY